MSRPPYADVLKVAEELSASGWQVRTLTTADGYPIVVLTDPFGTGGAASELSHLLIATGIHGEEPAGVLGLTRWLKQHSLRWVGAFKMDVFPCLNPWGFERGIRYAQNGQDLNRQFDRPRHPAVQAFSNWITGRTFDLFLDLHEDSDFERMYLYELLDPHPGTDVETLGRRILNRAAEKVAVSHGDDVDELQTVAGIVSGSMTRSMAAVFEGRPIAIEVFAHHAPHVVTVETPGRLDLELRIQLQVDALETAAAYLADRSI